MSIIIRIWLLISCIAFGIHHANRRLIHDRLKEKHPNAEIVPASFKVRMEVVFNSILLCACPILHIFTLYISIFYSKDIIARTVEEIERRTGIK